MMHWRVRSSRARIRFNNNEDSQNETETVDGLRCHSTVIVAPATAQRGGEKRGRPLATAVMGKIGPMASGEWMLAARHRVRGHDQRDPNALLGVEIDFDTRNRQAGIGCTSTSRGRLSRRRPVSKSP